AEMCARPADSVRADRWLWAARLFKSRALAAAACTGGKVEVNDQSAKPARLLRPGDLVRVTLPAGRRIVRTLALAQPPGPAAPAPRSATGSTGAGRGQGRWPTWVLALLVALVVFAAFAPALSNGFVNWDDDVNITDNPHFRGFSAAHLRWMFTTTLMGHYIPLTWLTLALDYALWGMNPRGYHLTSVLLHALDAALVFLVARRLLRDAPVGAAAAAALVFGLHPLRVESVAWVTERRDVVSGVFVLL